MHFQESSMFYKTYPLDSFFEEMKRIEKEQKLLLSYLPEAYAQMQKKTEALCDRMEYEGSRMYDDHPDTGMVHRMSRQILKELEEEGDPFWTEEKGDCREDLICCFLCHEILCRRYRSWLIKRYIRT